MARRFTKNGTGRGKFIEEYSKKKPENLAELLFDERNENREMSERIARLSHKSVQADILMTANCNLRDLLKSTGMTPKRYIVTTEYCECGDEDESCHCEARGCEYWQPVEKVDTFSFYDFAIDNGSLEAIDVFFNTCSKVITKIVDDETGHVIWER